MALKKIFWTLGCFCGEGYRGIVTTTREAKRDIQFESSDDLLKYLKENNLPVWGWKFDDISFDDYIKFQYHPRKNTLASRYSGFGSGSEIIEPEKIIKLHEILKSHESEDISS